MTGADYDALALARGHARPRASVTRSARPASPRARRCTAPLLGLFVAPGTVAPEPPRDASGVRAINAAGRYAGLFHELLDRGVALAPGAYEVLFCSMAHDDAAIARTAELAHDAASALVARGG